MSAFADSASSRNWWSLSSKSEKEFGSVHLSRDKSSSFGKPNALNSLASAIGLRSKKQHPSLTIQSPPPRNLPDPRPNVIVEPRYANRPPSKSVSSTIRSSDEPIEAKTPEDLNVHAMRYRQSLLTLSDIDPFATTGMSPRTLTDPNRLSAYSNSSAKPDSPRKNADTNRISYGSSSSNSHAIPISPVDSFGGSSRSRQASVTRPHPREMWESTGSSSHATDVTRFSQPSPAPVSGPLPKMRPRGMTDVGIGQTIQQFLRDESPPRLRKPSVKGPPRVVVRQASLNRVGQPPSAPPIHDLPTPPSIHEGNGADHHSRSASSSSSSFGLHKDPLSSQSFNPRLKEKHIKHDGKELPPVSPLNVANKASRLKKSASHQSLRKHGSISSVTFTEITPVLPDRIPKKQRSFHHPKVPLPPLPTSVPNIPSLRHANSFTPTSTISSPHEQQRRGSASSVPLIRKRLFSGSRRPSTAQSTMSSSVLSMEDDVRSVFSLPGEMEQSIITQPSFWDEGQPDTPTSPMLVEYTPQQIMSPAEMLKIEESVRDGAEYVRPRADSFASTYTTSVHNYEPPNSPSRRRPASSRGNSLMAAVAVKSSPPNSRSSSPPLYTSLSPPPRPRPRQAIVDHLDNSSIRGRSTPEPHFLEPRLSRNQSQRQSLLRKPSFLDIDFETDGDLVTSPTSSFLDLNRNSFDTVRSIN